MLPPRVLYMLRHERRDPNLQILQNNLICILMQNPILTKIAKDQPTSP